MLHHGLERGILFHVLGHIITVIFGVRNLLVFQVVQIRVVIGTGVSNGQAAGLVVSGYKNQRFIGVLFVKFQRLIHCVSQSPCVGNGGSGYRELHKVQRLRTVQNPVSVLG